VIRYSNASLFMLRPTFRRCFAPGAFIPACGQLLVHLLVDCSCPRLSSSQSCARKRFFRRTARSYRIRLHGINGGDCLGTAPTCGNLLDRFNCLCLRALVAACLSIPCAKLVSCAFLVLTAVSWEVSQVRLRYGTEPLGQRVQHAAAGYRLLCRDWALRESRPCLPLSRPPHLNCAVI
jgi:hypothetical protein